VDFTFDDEFCVPHTLREIAGEEHAHLVGEDLVAGIVDHAAAIAVAVEAERKLRARTHHRIPHRAQHVQVFGVGIVFREIPIERGVHRHDVRADPRQRFRRERACGAVAAGRHHADGPGHVSAG
jgi:hypothetical protein